jgi:hypothetical protein
MFLAMVWGSKNEKEKGDRFAINRLAIYSFGATGE